MKSKNRKPKKKKGVKVLKVLEGDQIPLIKEPVQTPLVENKLENKDVVDKKEESKTKLTTISSLKSIKPVKTLEKLLKESIQTLYDEDMSLSFEEILESLGDFFKEHESSFKDWSEFAEKVHEVFSEVVEKSIESVADPRYALRLYLKEMVALLKESKKEESNNPSVKMMNTKVRMEVLQSLKEVFNLKEVLRGVVLSKKDTRKLVGDALSISLQRFDQIGQDAVREGKLELAYRVERDKLSVLGTLDNAGKRVSEAYHVEVDMSDAPKMIEEDET